MFKLRLNFFGGSAAPAEEKVVPPPEQRFGRFFPREDKMVYDKPVIDQYAYDIDKWQSLILLDDEVAEAAIHLRSLGRSCEDELAERYLANMDKARLPGLVQDIMSRRRPERPSAGFPF